MGFWKIFKKQVTKPIEKERVSKKDLQEWLKKYKSEIDNKEKEFFLKIKEIISKFTLELKEAILILEEVSLDNKKIDEKIKLIVEENLKNYILYLEKFLEKLEGIKDPKNILEEIESHFSNFKKSSKLSYEKVTLIVGKEMGKIKEILKKFSKEIDEFVKENKTLIYKMETKKFFEENISQFETLKNLESEIEEKIKLNKEKMMRLRKEKENNQEKIEKLKKSEEFTERIKKIKEKEIKEKKLEKDIYELKSLIDFKALTSFYHIFEKEMKIIKEYKEDFVGTFNKSEEGILYELIKKANLDNEKVFKKIKEIHNLRKDINEIIFEKIELDRLEKDVEKINLEINSLEETIKPEEKKLEKIKSNLREILNRIKIEMNKIGVELD